MLSERFPLEFIAAHLLPVESWCPFPPAADRTAWEGLLNLPLNRRRCEHVLAMAERCLANPWPVIPVSRYFDYVRDGDRTAFERLYMGRRQDLAAMALAACFGHETRHIEAAVDRAWAICEESSWAISAHVDRRNGSTDVMPDLTRPSLDLFACETAAVLAEMMYLLGAELDVISPAIRERIEGEILGRIVEPAGRRDDVWWLEGQNNWTPWCVSNILIAAGYTVREPGRLAALISRMLVVLDRFLTRYPEDGFCDEGPGYWGVSPGALLMALEMLHSRTGGAVNVYDEPTIAEMGRYIRRIHLAGSWFFNHADCPGNVRVGAAKAYRYGERIGDDGLRNLVLLAQRNWRPDGEPDATLSLGVRCGDLPYAVRELFWVPGDGLPHPLSTSRCDWYPGGQVLVARALEADGRGLVLAAKGGHNAENHNHNDVGEFVVYADGQPVIVDPGSGTYRRQTFSEVRYGIWWISGRGHDVLQFGEQAQPAGEERRARVIRQDDTAAETSLELELAGAYPATAGVRSWRRSYRLVRGADCEIRIVDRYELARALPVSFPLFTPVATKLGKGRARFGLDSGRTLVMTWDPAALAVTQEDIEDRDPRLENAWGAPLSRLVCRFRAAATTGEGGLSFRIEEGA